MTEQVALSPHTNYVVCAAPDFASFNLQTLIDFYQPIMSPHTLGLFLALREQLTPNPLVTNAQPLSSLLLQVNAGWQQAKDGLSQLEGLRLLKSFRDAKDDVLFLELQRTLTPAEFIHDDLLSVLCLQMVGAEHFKQLSQQALQYQVDLSNYENTTHSFFDVFKLDQNSQTINDPLIQNARDSLTKLVDHRVDKKQLLADDFDFHFLAQQLADQGVSEQELQKHKQLILTEHLVYGLDELSLAKLIARAVDLVSGKLDPQQFKYLIRAQANSSVPKSEPSQTDSTPSTAPSQATNDLSDQERSLVATCERMRPIDFLAQLKQQTGSGYISPAEKNTVERLVSNLNPAAVNVLIWYIIGERGNASLSANFADAIANNWLQQGVKDASSALKSAKNYQQNRQSLKRPHKTYYKKKAVHEQLPKWAQPGYKEQNEEASPEQAAAMRRLLEKGEQASHDSGKRGENNESSK